VPLLLLASHGSNQNVCYDVQIISEADTGASTSCVGPGRSVHVYASSASRATAACALTRTRKVCITYIEMFWGDIKCL
jgi:hypothetical protein